MATTTLRSHVPSRIYARLARFFASLAAQVRVLLSKLQSKEKRTWERIPSVYGKNVTIETQKLPCNATGTELQMSVPKIHPVSEIHHSDPTLLAAHISFRYTAEPWLMTSPEKSEKRFSKELASIHMTFPYVTDTATLLSMAAWFSVLCKVDDLTEVMEPVAARHALELAQHSTAKDWKPDLGKWTELEDHLSPEAMIHHVVRDFSRYTHDLLPASTHAAFIADINRVFEWMLFETNFRNSPPTTIDSYMMIRKETIAIVPFFALVKGHLNLVKMSENLTELMEFLKEIIGLQNDLIGLDKDIQSGWPMNVVMVLRKARMKLPSTGSLEETAKITLKSVREANEMHNAAVGKAIKRWKAIQDSRLEAEKQLSDVIMVFMNSHFRWAMASKRYK